mmetsp:Transcript_33620/g.79356  ORF Transcript_33620/g.79356 Transcript_33620/m.79356 type:complete len:277 (-) Transcript_33620:482-1312(-)
MGAVAEPEAGAGGDGLDNLPRNLCARRRLLPNPLCLLPLRLLPPPWRPNGLPRPSHWRPGAFSDLPHRPDHHRVLGVHGLRVLFADRHHRGRHLPLAVPVHHQADSRLAQGRHHHRIRQLLRLLLSGVGGMGRQLVRVAQPRAAQLHHLLVLPAPASHHRPDHRRLHAAPQQPERCHKGDGGEVFHFWRGPVQAGRDPRGVGGPSQRPIHLELPLLPLLAAGPRRRDAGKHPPRGARESAQGHARLLPFWHLCSHPAPGPQRPNGRLAGLEARSRA